MKNFKGKTTQIQCPNCHVWVYLQRLLRVAKSDYPTGGRFSDGAQVSEYSRVYECPICNGIVLRCRKQEIV